MKRIAGGRHSPQKGKTITTMLPAYVLSLTGAVLVAARSAGPIDTPRQPQRLNHSQELAINPTDQSLYAATHYGRYCLAPMVTLSLSAAVPMP